MTYAEFTPKPKRKQHQPRVSKAKKSQRTDLARQYHQLHPMQLAFLFPSKYNYNENA